MHSLCILYVPSRFYTRKYKEKKVLIREKNNNNEISFNKHETLEITSNTKNLSNNEFEELADKLDYKKMSKYLNEYKSNSETDLSKNNCSKNSNKHIDFKPKNKSKIGKEFSKKMLQKINNLNNFHTNKNFIVNSTWKDAPEEIDLSKITSFPLFNTDISLNSNKVSVEDIKSIGIFEDGYKSLPSVKKILNETMPESSKIALETWKKKMILQLGESGFEEHQKGNLYHFYHSFYYSLK